jgi:hypothetical protein
MPDEDIQIPKFGYCSLYLTKSFSAPVDGESIYFVLDQSPKQTTLLHPFTLTKFVISSVTFQESVIKCSWNPTNERVVKLFKDKMNSEKSLGHKGPYVDVEEIIKYYSQ